MMSPTVLISPPEIPVVETLDRPAVVGTLEEAGSLALSDSQLIGPFGEDSERTYEVDLESLVEAQTQLHP